MATNRQVSLIDGAGDTLGVGGFVFSRVKWTGTNTPAYDKTTSLVVDTNLVQDQNSILRTPIPRHIVM